MHKKNKELPHYKINDEFVKVPAAWLIDKAGFKGYQKGKTAVHDKQALVLINKAEASGDDILALSGKIKTKVKDLFGIELEQEVNLFP